MADNTVQLLARDTGIAVTLGILSACLDLFWVSKWKNAVALGMALSWLQDQQYIFMGATILFLRHYGFRVCDDSFTELYTTWYFLQLFPPIFHHITGDDTDDNFISQAYGSEFLWRGFVAANLLVRFVCFIFPYLHWVFVGALGFTSAWQFLPIRIKNLLIHTINFTWRWSILLLVTEKYQLWQVFLRMPLGEPTCSLCHYWLGNAPPYQAISYTWGGQTPSIPLNIDGNSMLVTPIVSDFIWHHASLLKEKYVWIDAVCINQSDLNEKTNQIQLMRDIYNGAAQVVIWLNATTLTKDATNLRAFLNLLCLAAMTGTDCRKNMESTFTLKEKEIALLSLNMFFSHSWFERIWVVQEISNDAKVFFVYGSMRIDWSTVAAAAVSLEAIRALRTEVMNAFANYGADVAEATATSSTAKSRSGIQHNNCTAMNHIKDRIQKKDPPTLGALLAWSIRYKATDRRDKVFAVIGMSKDGAVLLSHLGYESRTEDVFIHTARHILSHNEWPVVLYSAGCGYRHISTAEAKLQLPSWVPTWSQEDNVGVSRPDEFERKLVDSAELPSEVGVQLTEILLVIRIFGIQFDSIHLMGPDRRLLLNAAYGSGSKHEPDQAWGEAHDEHRQWHVDSRDFIRKSSAAGATSEAAADEELWQTLMSASNDRTPEYLARTKHAWDTCMLTRSKDITNSTDMEFFLLFSQMPDIMQGNLSRTITGKRLAVTKGGATALVPLDAEVDDIICWIKGTTLPFLLRSTKSGRYELVGTCYVHGAHAYTGWDWQSYLVE